MPVRYSSADLIKIVEEDGWIFVRSKGSHHHFKHFIKKGIVTIVHPKKEERPGTASSVLRQAGLKVRK